VAARCRAAGTINVREIHWLGDSAALDTGFYTFDLTKKRHASKGASALYIPVQEGQWGVEEPPSSFFGDARVNSRAVKTATAALSGDRPRDAGHRCCVCLVSRMTDLVDVRKDGTWFRGFALATPRYALAPGAH
jgi:hypothetical protein